MINALAHSINAANITQRARISALEVDASLLRRTIRVDDALGVAAGLRVPVEVLQARAHRAPSDHRAMGVRPARRRVARVDGDRRLRVAPHEGVAHQAGIARAHGMVFFHAARRLDSARSRTRVAAAVAHAREVVGALVVDPALRTTATCWARRIARHSVGTLTHGLALKQTTG